QFSLGDFSGSEKTARELIERFPSSFEGYFALGYMLAETESGITDIEASIEYYEQALERKPDLLNGHWNVCESLDRLGQTERLRAAAKKALPLFEKDVRMRPTNSDALVGLAHVYIWSGDLEKGKPIAEKLFNDLKTEGLVLYYLTGIYQNLNEPERILACYRRALESGVSIRDIRVWITSEPMAKYREREDFQELLKEIERREGAAA
ncbi:MAG TPA: hypothetical protein VGM92_10950, partial [Candidatus Kapabacteria bacterium]